jgi:peptide/nickel transport system ATP-binding protein
MMSAAAQDNSGKAPLLSVRGLTVDFPDHGRTIRASGDVTFSIAPGEIVALVGESGSGKSITATAIMGLVPKPGRIVGGTVMFEGEELTALSAVEMSQRRAARIGWVSQAPQASLNPSFRIRDQLIKVVQVSEPEVAPRDRASRAAALLEPLGFPDVNRVLNAYPHELSGGMCQRVCIAMALAGNPSLIIADEPTTALDVSIQAQILALLRKLNRERGVSILFITHDLAVVSAMAHRVIVLYGGEIQEVGQTRAILGAPSHPYTRGLLLAIPDPSRKLRRLEQLPGQAEAPVAGYVGCRFAPRCAYVMPVCTQRRPNDTPVAHGGTARCHLLDKEGQAA